MKRSKKKLTVTDVEKSFQPFDYSAAESSCIKGEILINHNLLGGFIFANDVQNYVALLRQ